MNTTTPSWEANHFTLIAFTPESLVGKEQALWLDLFENKFDKLNQTQTNGSVEGQYENCHFIIETDHLRVKITQVAELDVDKIESPFPSVGNIKQNRDMFDTISEKWLTTCQPISRLAFVSNLAAMTSSKEESYKMLSQLLNYPRLENASDFNLQINRIRKSSVIDGEINRLVRWRAALAGIKGRISGSDKEVHLVENQNVVGMSLDINNVPLVEVGATLPQGDLVSLYEELVAMALDIAAHGDID